MRQAGLQVSAKERGVLRDLGRRVAEIAALPAQQEKAGLWLLVNRLERTRPPVLVWLTGAWEEMPDETRLTTEGELAQSYERDLRRRIYHHEHLDDDRVITASVPVPLCIEDTGWGVEAHTTAPSDPRGAKRYEGVLESFSDLERIRPPRISVDWDATRRREAAMRDVFDGLLDVETAVYWGNNYGAAPMDTLATWRGLAQLFTDLVDNPGFVHEAMARIVDGHVGVVDQLESQKALHLNCGRGEWVGTGALGYTDELPADGFDPGHVRPRDLWGTCAAQVFAAVSPAMHEEFCLRHERRFLGKFGLTCYGCCEPLDRKIPVLRSIPNLRRISISAWADIEVAAEQLQDDYIFSWKPDPEVVSRGAWDPELARRRVRDFLRATGGCVREIVLKDLETVGGEPRRLSEWLAIAREEIAAA